MKRRLMLTSLAAAVVLAACKKAPEGTSNVAPPPPAAGTTPVSIEAITAEARGFDVGSTMAAHVYYVFFDPQCPHCAALWEIARPFKAQARFVWIPVGLLNDKSPLQGAAILAAGDPVAAMDQHEASMKAQQGGIQSQAGQDAQKEAVKKNTALMTRFGFGSVPTIVGKNAQSGELVTIEGAVPAPVLAQKLGLQAPA